MGTSLRGSGNDSKNEFIGRLESRVRLCKYYRKKLSWLYVAHYCNAELIKPWVQEGNF